MGVISTAKKIIGKDSPKGVQEVHMEQTPPDSKEALEALLSPKIILRTAALRLRGYQPDPVKENNWVMYKESKPTMNECGIARMMGIIGDFVNENTFLSKYDKSQIEYKCRFLDAQVGLELYNKHEAYGVDLSQIDLIVTTVVHAAQSALLRALDGATMNMVGKTTHIAERREAEKKKGTFPGF